MNERAEEILKEAYIKYYAEKYNTSIENAGQYYSAFREGHIDLPIKPEIAIKAIQLAAERGNEWISVEDDRPKPCKDSYMTEDYLTLSKSGGYEVLAYNYQTLMWTDGMQSKRRGVITHWMPLPKPPNNE